MGYLEEMAKLQTTEKQREFSADFLARQQVENYEFWDEIEIGKEAEIPLKFEVKAEDMIAYAEGVPDANPVFYDEEYAKKCGYDGLVPHPLFTTQVLFYFGWGGWGISPAIWAVIMLVVATVLGFLMLWREYDIAYTLVLVWAFIGIANSQADTSLVANTAWLVSLLLVIAMIFAFFFKRRST